ncbi:RpiB/LacA/LacB family sugar-phosphate isomerase [Candidatus Roizmanbacteria bacterium]|nr:RpiB/LacA/LacB family sugar-phosphate isomerase [Candidatus Roizmanbacteria bacterium]
MTIFIGADHRGFDLKNKLIEYLQEKNIRVEDLGAYELQPLDDNPDYAQKVAQAVLQNPKEFLGIVICGSGGGVTIAANRHKGIYCGLGFDDDQVKNMREHDHINILALPADYIDLEKAKRFADVFLSAQPSGEEKYIRRLKKTDSV